jgi:hypothetical protein
MADDRVSIIKRIYKDDDPKSGVWVDIERISKMTVTAPHPDNLGLQKIKYSFDWDKFDSDVEHAAGQDTDYIEFKEISDPNDPPTPGDPSSGTTIKIPLRRQLVIEDANNTYRLFFENHEDNKTRKVHTKRVYHYDIPDDQLDKDGQPPSDPTVYINLLTPDAKDDGQYIDVEIIDGHTLEQNKGQSYSKKNWAQDINSILSEAL